MLAWAVCWRDKDPDAIQATHLAQVTEQNKIISLFSSYPQ